MKGKSYTSDLPDETSTPSITEDLSAILAQGGATKVFSSQHRRRKCRNAGR